VIADEALASALELIAAVFSPSKPSPLTPEELPGELEARLGVGRKSWPLPVLRRLADAFLEASEGRKKSPAHEARWLNLAGFCLRPGFGAPGDDFRIELARRVYAAGLMHANRVQCEIDWYLLWGRVAGGLNPNQQADLYQRLAPWLLSRGQKKPRRLNAALLREMWRTAASLELLPVEVKTELGDALSRRIAAGDYSESELWCLSRLGARQLLYGPINLVVPPATVAHWVTVLLDLSGAGDALAAMARRTDDPTRDLEPATRERVRRKLEPLRHSERLLAAFEGQGEDDRALGRIFGEDLPVGLVWAESPGG
jgi:hypothetical protein